MSFHIRVEYTKDDVLTGEGLHCYEGGESSDRPQLQALLRPDHRQRQHGRDVQQAAAGDRDTQHGTTVGARQLGVLSLPSTSPCHVFVLYVEEESCRQDHLLPGDVLCFIHTYDASVCALISRTN